MWICKQCGSTKIRSNISIEFSKSNRYRIGKIKSIFYKEALTIDNTYTDTYWCENCMNEKKDINELADWSDE